MRIIPPDVVRIAVSPSVVTFSAHDLTFTTEPVVHLQPSRGRVLDGLLGVRLRGVGRDQPRDAAHSVRVFDRASTPPPGYSREQCLSLFFRYGLAQLINQFTFRARPNVEVTGAPRLYAALGAETQDLLARALRMAGARRISLVDGPAPRP
jgi:hypothetical protein